MKTLNFIRTIILGLLLFTAVVSDAQQQKIEAAVDFLQKNDLENAKVKINEAVADPETKNEASAWYYRGFIYKSIYKKNEKSDKHSPARAEAFNSFKKSLSLDTDKQFFTDNINSIKWIGGSYHNDANEFLDPVDFKTAIELFNLSEECYKIVDPSPAARQASEIAFDLALGSVFQDVLRSALKDSLRTYKFMNLAKNVYLKVLAMDPKNISANYGMGSLYYNQAVNIIQSLDIETDLTLMDGIEENTKKLGREAEPFMQKAYTDDPKRVEALEGLNGIYYILKDNEKYTYYKKKLEEIKKTK